MSPDPSQAPHLPIPRFPIATNPLSHSPQTVFVSTRATGRAGDGDARPGSVAACIDIIVSGNRAAAVAGCAEPPSPWFPFNACHEIRSGASSATACSPITVARREGTPEIGGSATVVGGARRVETIAVDPTLATDGRGPMPAAIRAGAEGSSVAEAGGETARYTPGAATLRGLTR